MKSNRNLLAGTLLAAGALVTTAAGITIATAADEPAAATPATTPGAGPRGHHGWHHHDGAFHMLSKLNLSAQQQASIKTIMANAGPQMKSIHQEMRANSLKLSQTQPTDANYASVVSQVTQANGSLHSQMITQREAVRAQIFKVLTPAQQTQLAALKAQMQARMQARRDAWAARGAGAPPAAQ
jgi:Spy/CpxP family protein refolding chaperone